MQYLHAHHRQRSLTSLQIHYGCDGGQRSKSPTEAGLFCQHRPDQLLEPSVQATHVCRGFTALF